MNNYVISNAEEQYKNMSAEEKASVLFADMSTAPLNDIEREHLALLFEDDMQNG